VALDLVLQVPQTALRGGERRGLLPPTLAESCKIVCQAMTGRRSGRLLVGHDPGIPRAQEIETGPPRPPAGRRGFVGAPRVGKPEFRTPLTLTGCDQATVRLVARTCR